MNAFEQGTRRVIPAVIVYGYRSGEDEKKEYLMLHRDSKTVPGQVPDYHSGKWNGLGGKLEADESPQEAAKREFFEESGIELPEPDFRHLGVLQFPNFKAHKSEDWVCWIFLVQVPMGFEPLKRVTEGSLHWIKADQMLTLNLWPGDVLFLPLVLKNRPFFGSIWYEGGTVLRHSVLEMGIAGT